jgi:hypothetical protein
MEGKIEELIEFILQSRRMEELGQLRELINELENEVEVMQLGKLQSIVTRMKELLETMVLEEAILWGSIYKLIGGEEKWRG